MSGGGGFSAGWWRKFPPSPEAIVVDVGCGTGGNIAALAGQYRCVGIDTSEEAIRLARVLYGGQECLAHPAPEFLTGRAPEGLGELAKLARLFLLTDVLEHIEDDRAMFAELVAAASPGCYFLVTVPADPSLWSQHDVSFGHYRRYGVARLAEVWAGLPVAPLMVSYFNSRLLPMVRLVRAWNQRRGRAAGRVGTDFWLPNPIANGLLTRDFRRRGPAANRFAERGDSGGGLRAGRPAKSGRL